MADYRYLLCDLLSDEVLAELQLTGVTYGQELNTAGTLSAHLMIGDVRENFTDIDIATKPGWRSIYVERDGTIVWGGIIWTRVYDSFSQTLTIGAREFESYFENRVVQSNETWGYLAWASTVDIGQIISDCFSAVINRYLPNSDIGINFASPTLGAVGGDGFVINDFEFRPFLDVVQQLSKMVYPKGFDFNVDISYDIDGNIVKTLNLEPHRGTAAVIGVTVNAPMLELPGNLVGYSWPEDGNSIVTEGFGTGNNAIWYGNPNLTSITNLDYLATAQLTDGAPLVQQVYSSMNQDDPTIVGRLTEAFVKAKQQPVTVAELVWDQVSNPQIGYFKTGDEFRIKIQDIRFPDGIDTVLRLSRYEVQAGENGPERITGFFVDPNAFV
jgi:hypothetical protein